MPKMPVMEAAVKILESEGVDVCFGVPGAAILPCTRRSRSPRRSST